MSTDTERLDEADACHDDEPDRGAELLRAISPAQLPTERRPNYAFLLNHVLGEKLNRWDEALQRQRQLITAAQPEPAMVLWRQAATAARLAGNDAAAPEFTSAFAHASGAPPERCAELIQLSAAMFRVPGLGASQAGEETLAALAPLSQAAWQEASPLDAAVAACASNLASGLVERPAADLQHDTVRAALEHAAVQGQRFWQRAGTWVHHERALYLRAMVGNATNAPQDARAHALAALALLDTHDTEHAEDVDRAFIELERGHACAQLGLTAEAADASRNAHALASRFGDAGLSQWFERRQDTLNKLPRG